MISNFTEQYFGGKKNWVNPKFKTLLNHSRLIIMYTIILFREKLAELQDWIPVDHFFIQYLQEIGWINQLPNLLT